MILINIYRLSELVESIAKKPIPPHVKALTLEMVVNDRNEEDVEVNIKTFSLQSLNKMVK